MYPAKPGLLFGFHGCEEAVLDEIINGRKLMNASMNGHDWLGAGCYFWENNYERALDFAINPPGKKKFEKPSVLGAVIDLQYCLDLLDMTYLKKVKNSYYVFARSMGNIALNLPINKPGGNSNDLLIRELDYSVIENLHFNQVQRGHKPFDSVRGVFIEGEELYPGAGFRDKNHIQICIRNPNCIKAFFIPLKEAAWQ